MKLKLCTLTLLSLASVSIFGMEKQIPYKDTLSYYKSKSCEGYTITARDTNRVPVDSEESPRAPFDDVDKVGSIRYKELSPTQWKIESLRVIDRQKGIGTELFSRCLTDLQSKQCAAIHIYAKPCVGSNMTMSLLVDIYKKWLERFAPENIGAGKIQTERTKNETHIIYRIDKK